MSVISSGLPMLELEKRAPSLRGELEITEAIQLLLEKGYDVGYQIVARALALLN